LVVRFSGARGGPRVAVGWGKRGGAMRNPKRNNVTM